MKSKNLIYVVLLFTGMNFRSANCQISEESIVGVWEKLPESGEYFKVYWKNAICYDIFIYQDGKIVIDQSIYGFYDNCEPHHRDSLRSEGSGEYFFETIDEETELTDDGSFIQSRIDCWSISIDHDRNKIEYESENLFLHFERRAILEYQKVYSLPEQLVTYLKKEEPEVYDLYVELTKKGKSPLSVE
ncbi:hypothetical protein [Reichenbachiella agariperforans]|uniref:hypothetical protein n=1 Tax=Reichenbachiella agariperforans TaxID=156994 RepID=UPI001C099078|nr:hypothetical protein [Reichenbachiella agariperforans]MBU2914762.1 hypothetical protein [Reichenbachiella agariperforans]